MPDPRTDLDRVTLDLHAAAPSVAELSPRHVAIERPAVELQARGQALDDRDEARAVRFAGCRESQGHAASVNVGAFPLRSGGCGPPRSGMRKGGEQCPTAE